MRGLSFLLVALIAAFLICAVSSSSASVVVATSADAQPTTPPATFDVGVALPPRCPSSIESILASAQHSQCLAGLPLQRLIFFSSDDSPTTRAAICRNPSCMLVLEALYLYDLLATPFDSCVLGEPDSFPLVVISSGDVADLVQHCDRHGLQRNLREGADVRRRKLQDQTSGNSSRRSSSRPSTVQVLLGISGVALLLCLACSFCPRRQEGAADGKTWFCGCVTLSAPAWV